MSEAKDKYEKYSTKARMLKKYGGEHGRFVGGLSGCDSPVGDDWDDVGDAVLCGIEPVERIVDNKTVLMLGSLGANLKIQG